MKKRNKLKHAILIYCEGQRDCDFVKHLKSIFCKNKKIKVQPGQGGGPLTIIQNAMNYNYGVEYKEKYIFLDSDRFNENDKKQKQKQKEAEKRDIILIWSPICLENLLLQILDDHHPMNSSQEYKKYFCNHHGGKPYSELFPKEKLNAKKDTIPTLKQLIKIIS